MNPVKREVLNLVLGLVIIISAFLGGVVYFSTHEVFRPGGDELADKIRPRILEKWHENPSLENAQIQKIALVHKDGNQYTGFVTATLDNKSAEIPLNVTDDDGDIIWELGEPDLN